MPQQRIGLYPGTFDPVTLGHMDIIERALHLVDHLVIGVASNLDKDPLFTVLERVEMMKQEIQPMLERGLSVEVHSFSGLLMRFAVGVGANVIVRGLRAVSDFEYECQMATVNSHLSNEIETVFLPASDRYQFISSRSVKEVAKFGGNTEAFVSAMVLKRLKERFSVSG